MLARTSDESDRLAEIGAGRLDAAGAAMVARTSRRVHPSLDETVRLAERSAWPDLVRTAITLAPNVAATRPS